MEWFFPTPEARGGNTTIELCPQRHCSEHVARIRLAVAQRGRKRPRDLAFRPIQFILSGGGPFRCVCHDADRARGPQQKIKDFMDCPIRGIVRILPSYKVDPKLLPPVWNFASTSLTRGGGMKDQIWKGKILKGAAVFVIALIAVRQFFVQELIAAGVIFAALFACIAFFALVLLALDQAWRTALARTEKYINASRRLAGRGATAVNGPTVANMLAPVLDSRPASDK